MDTHADSMSGLKALLTAANNRSADHPYGDFFANLSKKEAYLRLIDSYRLRASDDVTWGGGNLHG